MCTEETLDLLAHENMDFRHFLERLSDGTSFASLIKEYKTKQGKIKLTPTQRKQIGQRGKKEVVAHFIRKNGKVDDDFKILDYKILPSNVMAYTIELKRTDETDSIIKQVRELRKNKDWYLNKIKGEVEA